MGETALFTIGKVTGVHGLKGYLRVVSFAESNSVFARGTRLLVGDTDQDGKWFSIIKTAPHKKGLLVLFDSVDRTIAETLVGKALFIHRDELPMLDDETYYWEDLVGLDVTDTKKGHLGKIASVIATGSNDVFVVGQGKNEVLVPAIASVVLDVDIDNNVMLIDLPEGL